MPLAREWTAAADGVICAMRGEGATWAAIGLRLGLSRNTVIERGRRLRAVAPPRVVTVVTDADAVSDDPGRGPLRAGHPLTWGLLTDEAFPEPGK
jgi:hypothetical protein